MNRHRCHFCPNITDDEHYCYGCKSYICDDCEAGWSRAAASTATSHEPGDHRIEADDDAADDAADDESESDYGEF